ncbi:MAG: putative Ig domain-containing protein, partial [Planctomycetota bacterium]
MARLILIILFSVVCLSGCGGGGGGSPEVESFPPTSIAYPNFGPFMVGSPINPIECIVVGGVPDLWTVTPALPDGLLLDPQSGAISGTPLEFHAPTPHTIFAQNDSGQVTVVISIFVLPASPCDLDFGATQFQFEQDTPLVPIEPSSGCGPAELWTITPTLPEGLLFSITSGTISGTPVLPGVATDYLVIASNPFGQGSVSISIEVLLIAPCDLQYPVPVQTLVVGEELPLQVPSSSCGAADSYSISPVLPDGLLLDPASGGLSGIALDAATTTSHTITAANGIGSSQFLWTLTVQPAAPCDLMYPLSLLSLGVGDALTPLSPTTNCGDPENYSISPALPPGIVLDTDTGVLEGIAQQQQPATSYQLTASNVTGQTSFELVIEVLPQPPCDLVYPSSPLTLQVGVPLASQVPSVGCGPVSLYQSAPALPAGLILDLVSGVISGTPTTPVGSASYLIEASNSSGVATSSIQITVLPQPPCDLQYPVSAQTLVVGEDLPVQLPTNGCGAVDSYSISPALPPGLSLDQTSGGISGIALDPATTTTHVITAANVSGESIFLWTLTVQPLAPCDLIYPLAVLSLDVGDTLTPLSPTTSCGDPETFTVVPALPTGIVLDPDSGVLAGIALQ